MVDSSSGSFEQYVSLIYSQLRLPKFRLLGLVVQAATWEAGEP